uniref:Uncharacterized protein AlNc14C109G6330 n=1 Tax=Albugo laibachii Nc14 TaxID=890382 RepID=F0WIC9_9STRA|nr:conserved hypothetical protein [Albugo laibachii Nc14]|eukprot:CCA21010.1 conserved hypothetical protein [Albugo laibachii Nc14]
MTTLVDKNTIIQRPRNGLRISDGFDSSQTMSKITQFQNLHTDYRTVGSAEGDSPSLFEARRILNDIIETLESGCRAYEGDRPCDLRAYYIEETHSKGNRAHISRESDSFVASDLLLDFGTYETIASSDATADGRSVMDSAQLYGVDQNLDENENILIDFAEDMMSTKEPENRLGDIEVECRDKSTGYSAFGSEEDWEYHVHKTENPYEDSERMKEPSIKDAKVFDAYALSSAFEFEASQSGNIIMPGNEFLTRIVLKNLEQVVDKAYKNQDDADDFGDFSDFAQCSSFEDSEVSNEFERFSGTPSMPLPPFGEFREEESIPNKYVNTEKQAKWEEFYASLPGIQSKFNELLSIEESDSEIDVSAIDFKVPESFDEQESLMFPPAITEILNSRLDTISSSHLMENVSGVPVSYLRLLHLILLDKIQDALKYKQDGSTVLTADSEAHMLYLNVAQSAQELLNEREPSEEAMLEKIKMVEEATTRLQFSLFEQTMHEGIMRIAKDAALSAEAKIAEQFAQQQSTSRPSSVLLAPFHSTRQLLSRGQLHNIAEKKESGDEKSRTTYETERRPSASDSQRQTPTGASAQKNFNSNGSHSSTNPMGNAREDEHSNVTSAEEQSEDESDGSSLSSTGSRTKNRHSKDAAPLSSSTISDTNSSGGNGSSVNKGSGGLMRKLATSLLSSTAHSSVLHERTRRRYVRLRAMTSSGSDPKIRTLEIDLEAINGGFDEVKWKCAGFLYDFEEVAHIAPSQIKVWAYPSQQLLIAKSEKSLLSKFFKSHAVWTIDIGAGSQCMDGVMQ